MIDYHRFCQIKDLHEHQGLNASQIAEALALDPRTVAYWLAPGTLPARTPRQQHSKLDPFKAQIVRLLERYPYSAAQIFQRLREQGFDGGYSIVKAYVRTVRPRGARLSHPGLCPGRVRPGRLGRVWLGASGANTAPTEFLCHGAVLQPHDVCGVHRLPDHGALPRLPPTRL